MASNVLERDLIAILVLFGYGSHDSVNPYDVFLKAYYFWEHYNKEIFVIFNIMFVVIFLTSYFVASILVTRYGGVSILGIATLLRGILYLAGHPNNLLNFPGLLLIQDIVQKLAFCALPDIWSRWSPSEERFSRAATVAFLFYPILLLRTDTTIGQWISNNNKRDTVPYTLAIALIIWSVIWLRNVKNDPTSDKALSKEEKKLPTKKIQIAERIRNGMHTYPWRSVSTSKPLWILCIVGVIYHVGVINSICITGKLKVSSFRNSLTENVTTKSSLCEWLSISKTSLIFWSKFLFYFVYGYAADWLKKRINIGKFYMCFGFLGSAIMLILLQYNTALEPDWAILYLLFTQSQVLFELVFLVNVMELSPRYSAFLYGSLKTFYQIAGPIVFYYLAQSLSDWEQWYSFWFATDNIIDYRLMFIIYILGAMIYWFWGSSKLQPANRIRNEEFELTK